MVYADAGCQGIGRRSEMAAKEIGFRVALRPGKRRVLPAPPEGRVLDWIVAAKARIRAKGERPSRVIETRWAGGPTSNSACRRPA